MRPRKKVLIVDTSDVNLSLRSFVIDNWGYKPIKAQSAIEAMKILKKYKAYSIDLIIVGNGITAVEVRCIANQAKNMLHLCPIYEAAMDIDPYDFRAYVKSKTSRKRGPREKVPKMYLMEKAA